jgi:hypothetical protein
MSPQTTIQILRSLTLGSYKATVNGDELHIRGPQPLAGPLPASIKARRDELVDFLNEWAGGVWPPAPGSALREMEQLLGWSLSTVLYVLEAAQEKAA